MRVAISLVLAVVLGSLVSAPAHADEREDRETARKEFAAGQAADRKKAWQDAIEHYLRANDLVPHPFAMFNIATDFERLGKLREAATWFERYLDSSSASAADREKVNRILIDLRNRPGDLQVTSEPDGARVVINGIPAGTTPYVGQLKGGLYRVAVEKGAVKDFKEITIEYGEPEVVQFVLPGAGPRTTIEPATRTPRDGPTGVVVVRGEPYGALVAVDGMPIGTLPLEVPVDPGAHTVRITADGFAPYERQVVVGVNSTAPVDVRLARALGTITPASGGLAITYLIGGGVGADVRGSGAMYLVEGGLRATRYDLSARFGRVNDVTAFDLLVRWALIKARLAPFIGGGYSYVSGGYGYALLGGLRWDFVEGKHAGLSLIAESGLRFYSIAPDSAGTGSTATSSGSIVPLMASLLISYR